MKRFLLLGCGVAGMAYGQACAVSVAAKGVQEKPGVVGFVLYSSEQGWPHDYTKSYKKDSAPAKAGTVEVKFNGVTPGRYAVVALHDENKNMKLDKKGSGRPKEGWGMSRDPKATLKTPKFDAAALELKCGDRVEMLMRYPGKGEK